MSWIGEIEAIDTAAMNRAFRVMREAAAMMGAAVNEAWRTAVASATEAAGDTPRA